MRRAPRSIRYGRTTPLRCRAPARPALTTVSTRCATSGNQTGRGRSGRWRLLRSFSSAVRVGLESPRVRPERGPGRATTSRAPGAPRERTPFRGPPGPSRRRAGATGASREEDAGPHGRRAAAQRAAGAGTVPSAEIPRGPRPTGERLRSAHPGADAGAGEPAYGGLTRRAREGRPRRHRTDPLTGRRTPAGARGEAASAVDAAALPERAAEGRTSAPVSCEDAGCEARVPPYCSCSCSCHGGSAPPGPATLHAGQALAFSYASRTVAGTRPRSLTS